MGPGHPECPERLDAIEDRLLVTGVGDALERFEAPEAALADIELAHDRMHVAALRGMSDRLNEELMAGGPNYAQLDTDTSINAHTWKAALRAAGAALAATDAVMAGELENAFCAVRPPGHHHCPRRNGHSASTGCGHAGQSGRQRNPDGPRHNPGTGLGQPIHPSPKIARHTPVGTHQPSAHTF